MKSLRNKNAWHQPGTNIYPLTTKVKYTMKNISIKYKSLPRTLMKHLQRILMFSYKSLTRILMFSYKSLTRILMFSYKSLTRILMFSFNLMNNSFQVNIFLGECNE